MLRGQLGPGSNNHPAARAKEAGAGVIIREATPDELRGWDELVARFDNCRIFHKAAWLRHIEAFSRAERLCLVFEKEGVVVACLPGFLVKKAFLRIFGSPLVGWHTESMGPVFDQGRISTREVFSALVPFLEERHGVQHIELVGAHLDGGAMKELGFEPSPQFTYRVPLFPGDEERAMKNIRSKTRNQLRKAIKLGLVARVEAEESFVDEFYDQLEEVFARRGKAIPFSRNRVLQNFRCMKDSGNLLAVSVHMPDDDTCIATGMFTIEEREMNLWGWAHRTRYRWYCPTELLTWTAMRKGMEAGCTTLDMGGGGEAKAKFGGVPDTTVCRWMRSRYPWLAGLRRSAEKAFRWQQTLRGRVARWRTSAGRRQAQAADAG